MNEKQHLLDELSVIFNRWQMLLGSLSEAQIHTPLAPTSWTVKDIVAHMWSWQQASVARAQAALEDKQPDYPRWWEILGPDPEEDVDRTNAWLFEASKEKPWQVVYNDWKTQYMRFLDLTRQIPEKDLLEAGRFTWMGSYPLAASTDGSLEHHRDHYEDLITWLKEHAGKIPGE